MLLRFVLRGDLVAEFLAIQPVVINSLVVTGVAAIFIMLVSSVIVLTAAFRAGSKLRKLALMSSTGYAFSGTILAIGVLIYAGYIDHLVRLISGGIISSFLIAGMGLLMLAYISGFRLLGMARCYLGCGGCQKI